MSANEKKPFRNFEQEFNKRPVIVSGRFKRGHSWALRRGHFLVSLYAGPFWGPALLLVIGH